MMTVVTMICTERCDVLVRILSTLSKTVIAAETGSTSAVYARLPCRRCPDEELPMIKTQRRLGPIQPNQHYSVFRGCI